MRPCLPILLLLLLPACDTVAHEPLGLAGEWQATDGAWRYTMNLWAVGPDTCAGHGSVMVGGLDGLRETVQARIDGDSVTTVWTSVGALTISGHVCGDDLCLVREDTGAELVFERQ